MTTDVNKRLLIKDLLDHSWVANSKEDLERLYERVVIQGKDWKMDKSPSYRKRSAASRR
jgi:hypothetical protein